jgi:ubiquinone/menaquinone biosynthesis C-methylase UbiE
VIVGRDKKLQSDVGFRLMALAFKLRDLVSDPRRSLEKARLGEGMSVVDYGCGPGSFAIPAAELVGQKGRVVAVDILPLAVEMVEDKASQKKLDNVRTVLVQGYDTGVETSSVDRVLVIDTIHAIEDPGALFREIHRMLKPDGLLFMEKGHMAMSEQRRVLEETGLFNVVESQRLMMLATPQ